MLVEERWCDHMKIKLSDYILENSVSDADVSDIKLEQARAELNVCLAILDKRIKDYDMGLYQELFMGPAAPATVPTTPAAEVQHYDPGSSSIGHGLPIDIPGSDATIDSLYKPGYDFWGMFANNNKTLKYLYEEAEERRKKIKKLLAEAKRKLLGYDKDAMIEAEPVEEKQTPAPMSNMLFNVENYVNLLTQTITVTGGLIRSAVDSEFKLIELIPQVESAANKLTAFVNSGATGDVGDENAMYVRMSRDKVSDYLSRMDKLVDESFTKVIQSLKDVERTLQQSQSNKTQPSKQPFNSASDFKKYSAAIKKVEKSLTVANKALPASICRL